MASYPGSVKTFTTKTADQVIDAAHVNDLQDEVTAVEDGLLTGISHDLTPSTTSTRALGTTTKKWKQVVCDTLFSDRLQSTSAQITDSTISTLAASRLTADNSTISTLTVARLTVTNLQVTGGSSGIETAKDYLRLYSTASTLGTANSSGFQSGEISWNTQVSISTATFHSTTTTPTRITPPSTGRYMVTANAVIDPSSGGTIRNAGLVLLVNSTTRIAEQASIESGSTGAISVATMYDFAASEYLEVRGFWVPDTNTGRLIIEQLSSFSPSVSMFKI